MLCVEYLIGGSPEYFDNGDTGAAYFAAARWWLIDRHGADNVIFLAVHRDEKSPHMIAYMVRIHEGRLSAKHWLGGKATLSAMQTDFAQTVGQHFGLERGLEGSTARHTTIRQFYSAINAPSPAPPHVEVATPPLFGREAWAKNEAARIAATLRPILTDAARTSRWGRFQERERRKAQATAKHQAAKARAALVEVEKVRAANERLLQALAEWTATFNAGLTDDQAAALVALADTMREANQREVKALPRGHRPMPQIRPGVKPDVGAPAQPLSWRRHGACAGKSHGTRARMHRHKSGQRAASRFGD